MRHQHTFITQKNECMESFLKNKSRKRSQNGRLVPRILESVLSSRGRFAQPSPRRKKPEKGRPCQMQLGPSEALRKLSVARKGQKAGLTGKCGYSLFYSFLFISAVICQQDDQHAFFPL